MFISLIDICLYGSVVKRFSETLEVVSSSLNADNLFFLVIILHILMFNNFNIAKVSFICYKMIFFVCFICSCIFSCFYVYFAISSQY